jgi:hypothetical protein
MIGLYTHRFFRFTNDNFKQILISFKRFIVAQKYIPVFDPPLIMTYEAGLFKCIYNKTLPVF